MKLAEFNELNFKADKSIIAFNAKYAQKLRFMDSKSNRKAKVIGLTKYLSFDGKKPFLDPFTTKGVSVTDIYIANSIVLMVKFDSIRAEEYVPLNVFLEANPSIVQSARPGSFSLSSAN